MTSLDRLNPGQTATVLGFSDDTPIVRRLTELGLVPGRQVTYLRNAPLRDPMQIRVGGSSLSLRHSDAALVTVELDD